MNNNGLEQLLELQEMDKELDDLSQKMAEIPRSIQAKKNAIDDAARALEGAKTGSSSLVIKRKEKESEVTSMEEKIKKHESELNAVKSNEAYRALLTEIETLKKNKNAVEDEILNMMEESEKSTVDMKRIEAESKVQRQTLETEIKALESQETEAKARFEAAKQKRDDFSKVIPQDIYSAYDYIRNKKKGIAIVYVEGDFCSGCNTSLTQVVINEARKGKNLVKCDACSRILVVRKEKTEEAAQAPEASPQPTA